MSLLRKKSVVDEEFNWCDAYEIPVIFIDGIKKAIEGFEKIYLYQFYEEGQEISFVNPLPIITKTDLHFTPRVRYANILFIRDIFQDIQIQKDYKD